MISERLRRLAPQMSDTEREALEAGSVWVDGDLFSGRPDFARLLKEPYAGLSERERAFLDGPVEEACREVREWDTHQSRDLPPRVWELLRTERFFGLTVPEVWGGHGFSPLGVSAIIGKLATRSLPLSAVVSVPNSVGPAELIASHGTPEQQRTLLPRLARGEEIPCFALTEPEAGSDAAAMQSTGRVFRDAAGVVRLRLDFDKRYITLAPVATLIALAVRLEDPAELLERGPSPGISVVLVPATASGVEIGRRHDPMGIPFPNGPIRGRGVVVDAAAIIGGPSQAGRGWRMLMEALSAGRSITLPGQASGGARMLARVVGAYAAVRRQFGVPIGRFEGIEEPLARLAGLTYMMEAARIFTCSAVNAGQRPSVISAVVKYQQTELVRGLVIDAMDVLGGAGLSRGPRNLVASGYAGAPIPITVEGANILTRTLIVFGQGAVRCHPFARPLMDALAQGETRRVAGLAARFGWNLLRNVAREKLLSVTRGYWAGSPVRGPTARYYRRLTWASTRFALLTDLALLALGPSLKRRGRLTGRFADVLAWMYYTLSALRRFEAEGRREEDLPLVCWAAEHGLYRIQVAFEGLLQNLDTPLLGAFCHGPWSSWCRVNPIGRPPSDALGSIVAAMLREPGTQRERLCAETFVPQADDEPVARLERALRLCTEAAPLETRLRKAMREGRLPDAPLADAIEPAREAGLIDSTEARALREASDARREVVEVDSFSLAEYLGRAVEPASEPVATA